MALCQVESTILETTILEMVLCQDLQVVQDQALIVDKVLLPIDQALQIVQDQIVIITQIAIKDRTIMCQETLLLLQETLETITEVTTLQIITEVTTLQDQHHLHPEALLQATHQEVVEAEVVVEDNPPFKFQYIFQERSQGVLFILNFAKYVSIY